MITATIAVCTRNRVQLLQQCLASLATQLAEPGQLEVLVVDNGSTDGTGEFLRSWAAEGDGRRWVAEATVGLSRARNAALAASDRNVVLFVDDDALTPPTWAAAHLATHANDERVGAAGGPIGLVWPAGRPDWITDELTEWFSALDLGDDPGPFPGSHGPYGTNMSVRRTAALAVGGFDHRLGRVGTGLVSREEADLTRRLVAAEWTIVYEPAAAVVQQVLPERLDRRWLFRRGWAQGVSDARAELLTGDARPRRIRPATAAIRAAASELRRAPGELPVQVRAVARAGAAVEFARDAVRGAWGRW